MKPPALAGSEGAGGGDVEAEVGAGVTICGCTGGAPGADMKGAWFAIADCICMGGAWSGNMGMGCA